ncbi:Hypothetical protein PHPALM_12101 [Phytophthora palmivora]|uniref:Gag protein n=1 Tax=Phytophthora palmivora TaxID=4796 RepID=A0A2P4Y0L8_9STRA|nr:Hypothetical protein PHPALM_12101 [Phytophthora palmivora]
MRVLATSLVGNPLPEHIKMTVFMDGLKVDPSRTQLFCVHVNTMEEAIQIALQEEYSHRQARTHMSVWQGHKQAQCKDLEQLELAQGRYPWNWVRLYKAQSVTTDVGSLGTYNVPPLPEGNGSSLPNLGARGARGGSHDTRARGTGVTRVRTAHAHGGLAPESLGALETRKSSGGLLVVHESVRGYGDPFRILIDSGASTNCARHQTVAQNGDKYADALRESEGRRQISVRLADGTAVNAPEVWMDLVDFDSTDSFLVLDMNKYDLMLGMPWLEKHEPRINWRDKATGACRSVVSDRALVGNVPTSGDRGGRRDAYAPEEVLGVADSNEGVAMSLATGHETKAHYQACGIATTASPNTESRRAVWASTVAVPDGTDQAGNIGPQAEETAEESAKGVSYVGNICLQAGNVVPQTAEAVEEDAESASGVGNIVLHRVEESKKKIESAACVSRVRNRIPRGVKKTSTRAEVSLNTSRVDNQIPHSESESPPVRPVEEQYHVFDGVSGRQVSALLNLEELSMKDFLVELKAG